MFNSAPQNVDLNSTAMPTGGLLGMATTPKGGLLGALQSPEAALLGSALMSAGHWVGTPVNLGQSIGNALMNASQLRQQQFENSRNIIQQNIQNKLLELQLRQMGAMQGVLGSTLPSLTGDNSYNTGASSTDVSSGVPASATASSVETSENPSAGTGLPGGIPLSNSEIASVSQKTSGMPITYPANSSGQNNAANSSEPTPPSSLSDNDIAKLSAGNPQMATALKQATAEGLLRNPQVGSQILITAREGTAVQKQNLIQSMKDLASSNQEYQAASQLKPLLDHYQDTLNNTDDRLFYPVVRSEVAPHFSTNFQILQNTARRIALLANQVFKVPARGWSINELQNQLQAMGAPNQQNKGAIQDAVNQNYQMINNSKQNYQELLNYYLKNGTTQGYKPVQWSSSQNSPSSVSTGMESSSLIKVQTPDGKIWNIAPDKLDAAISRGAKRIN